MATNPANVSMPDPQLRHEEESKATFSTKDPVSGPKMSSGNSSEAANSNDTPTLDPSLSLEEKIEASVSAHLVCRFGPVGVSLDAQVKAALDHAFGEGGVKLNALIDASVETALNERLGAFGNTHNAESTVVFSDASYTQTDQDPDSNPTIPHHAQVCDPCSALTEGQVYQLEQELRNGDDSRRESEDRAHALIRNVAGIAKPAPAIQTDRARKHSQETNGGSIAGLSKSGAIPILEGSPSTNPRRSGSVILLEDSDGESIATSDVKNLRTGGGSSSSSPLGGSSPNPFRNIPAYQDDESLFVSEYSPAMSAMFPPIPKRKPSAGNVAGTPAKKKAKPPASSRWNENSPGWKTGSLVPFLKVCDQLSRDPKQRGYPKVVDLANFTVNNNMANFTMADVVATVLCFHNLQTLQMFLDSKNNPSFNFIRKELVSKKRNFVIEKIAIGLESKVTVSQRSQLPEETRAITH